MTNTVQRYFWNFYNTSVLRESQASLLSRCQSKPFSISNKIRGVKKTKWKCWKIVVWMRVVFNYGKTPRPWFIVVINKEIKMLLWPAPEQDPSVSLRLGYCLTKDHKTICQQNEKSKLIAKIRVYIENTDKIILCACSRETLGWHWLQATPPRAGKVSLIKICCMPANFVAAPCCQY